MSVKPILKRASLSDKSVLTPFIQAYHKFEKISSNINEVEEALTPLLIDDSFGCVWLICLEERPIGYIVLCFSYSLESLGRDALIDEMFIAKEFRGGGLGKSALNSAVEEAKKFGVKAIYLEVNRNNVRAQEFYKSLGFRSRDQFFLMDLNLKP